MNSLSDPQAALAAHPLPIAKVGVDHLEYPLQVCDGRDTQRAVGTWSLSANLLAAERGTHMSRFIHNLEEIQDQKLNLDSFCYLSESIRTQLGALNSYVRCEFPWIIKVKAPISGIPSTAVYQVSYGAVAGANASKSIGLKVKAQALCPCSKAISDRGAHNQRTLLELQLSYKESSAYPDFAKLIQVLESSASARLYPILKRPDEKKITEEAYDNPRFVEDLIRLAAHNLKTEEPGWQRLYLRVTNYESIHAHDCFAELELEGPDLGGL